MSRLKSNYKVYNGKKIKGLLKNSRVVILAILFTFGMIIGAMCTETNIINELSIHIKSYMATKSGQGILELFCNSMFSNIVFMALTVFLAFSIIGYPLIIWIPFLKGLGLGVVCGFMYVNYKLSGFGYSVLTIIPGATMSTFALVSACNYSCEYSKNAYLKSVIGKGQFEKDESKIFLIRQFFLLVICALSSMIDSVLSFAFLRFFEF